MVTSIWYESQMPEWAGFILGQILHYMEQNSPE